MALPDPCAACGWPWACPPAPVPLEVTLRQTQLRLKLGWQCIHGRWFAPCPWPHDHERSACTGAASGQDCQGTGLLVNTREACQGHGAEGAQ